MGALTEDLSATQLEFFVGVFAKLQDRRRVLTVGSVAFTLATNGKPAWWLRYFRVALRNDGMGLWELSAAGIRLAAWLRLQGRL